MSSDAPTADEQDVIKITGEFTPDPQVCKFNLDRTIVEDWHLTFQSAEDSLGSPLVDALFAVEGVAAVKVSGSALTIAKSSEAPWPELAREIVPAIRAGMAHEAGPISQPALDAASSQPVGDIEATINELFADHINPAIASHGGWVKLVKVDGNDVHLELGGGCQGCASSKATLKYGIEQAIREAAPQVREVIDVTDHSAGENPYYS